MSSCDPVPGRPLVTLPTIARHRAEATPDVLAYRFLADRGDEAESLTYAQLDRRARAVAAVLAERAPSGSPVVLCLASGLDYVCSLFGCMLAGMIAVPTYPPSEGGFTPAIGAFADDSKAALVLTTTDLLPARDRPARPVPAFERRSWLCVDDIDPCLADRWRDRSVRTDDVALIQYTSGSTARPRGVVLTHANLMVNCALVAQHTGQDSEDSFVSWLPPYHDMGLIGTILQPMYGGSQATLMSPTAFLQRPGRWLEAMSRYGGTHTAAPDFAYALCVRYVTDADRRGLDLSRWRVAISAAEPVRAETIDRFTAAFSECGFRREAFRPAYGLAEATLLVTTTHAGDQPAVVEVDLDALERGAVVEASPDTERTRRLVGCGAPVVDTTVAIVDTANGRLCEDDEVGEVWVSGPTVATGYWDRPTDTSAVFGARLTTTGDQRFLRTGDAAFRRAGELYITGRLKDMILTNGRNVWPDDVELTAERSHPSLRAGCGVAFATAGDRELVVLVQELRKNVDGAAEPAIRAIRDAVLREHRLPLDVVVLVAAGSLPKTSSGKKRRQASRQQYDQGRLDIVAQWRAGQIRSDPPAAATPVGDRHAITRWLVAAIAERLNVPVDQVDPSTPLANLGLGSVDAAALAAGLGTRLGCDLPPTLVFDYPTVETMAAHLAQFASVATKRGVGPSATNGPLDEPLAVVGIGCRFPGADSLASYRSLLRTGAQAITRVPPDRWDVADLYNPEGGTGKMLTQWGGFIEDVDRFDARFFGVSPREAARMDPQQRLLLEVAWEALEDAGQPPSSLAGSQTAVFIGIGGIDYSLLLSSYSDRLGYIDGHTGTGNAHSIAANRLSFLLDLRGPSMAVDTACSSSLVAVHLAGDSLRCGESDLALVGGVNLILTPEATIAFSAARMLSPSGRCRSFDAAADGYVRSEGCGVIVLKRLSDALRGGDRIHAVIRGSAVNQDGQTNGLTAPNPLAQQAVMRFAWTRAGIDPDQIGYIEAHGTGTPLGDPIELSSISTLIGTRRPPTQPCLIGSSKSNIGHLEAASGIAGLLKAVLAVEYGEIYGQANFERLNPRITLDPAAVAVATKLTRWPAAAQPRLAGVNSFGFGGTNAHVVVEEAPAIPPRRNPVERPRHVLALSASEDAALRALTGRYADFLDELPDEQLPDACFSANTGRERFAHRVAVSGASGRELAAALRAYACGDPGDSVAGIAAGTERPRVAFLFTGQGAQYRTMGEGLYRSQPAFREALDECAELVDGHLDQPLRAVLFSPVGDTLLAQTRYAQPALFALEYALARLWMSWGITPDVLLGHSVGEYPAACLAGVFALEDAVTLIAERSRLMQTLPDGGVMAAVAAGPDRVHAALAGHAHDVAIAAVNSPRAVTISGSASGVQAVLAVLAADDVAAQPLAVSHAFHSPLMEPVLDAFQRVAGQVTHAPPRIPMISNITGCVLAPGEVPDAAYWRRQAREPVRFADGVATLHQLGVDVFVEVGPHPTLIALARRCPGSDHGAWLPSLRRGTDDLAVIQRSLQHLFVLGAPVDWREFERGLHRRRVATPTYPFQRSRHWVEPRRESAAAPPPRHGGTTGAHPLLNEEFIGAHRTLHGRLGTASFPYLAEHRIDNRPVLAAAAWVEMALAAASTAGTPTEITDLELSRPLVLDEAPVTVQAVAIPNDLGRTEIRLYSERRDTAGAWTLHATAMTAAASQPPSARLTPLDDVRERCPRELSADELYAALSQVGLHYGPAFRPLERLWVGNGEALSRLTLPSGLVGALSGYRLHPALFDGCLQTLAPLVAGKAGVNGRYLPVGIGSVRAYADTGEVAWCHARLDSKEGVHGNVVDGLDFDMLGPDGTVLAEVRNVGLRRWQSERAQPAEAGPSLYTVDWVRQNRETRPQPEAGGHWLLLGDEGKRAAALAGLLSRSGQEVTVVDAPGDQLGTGEQPERLRGIVCLWPLDAIERTGTDAPAEASRVARGVLAAVKLASSMPRSPDARLVVVTGGVHPVATTVGEAGVAQAAAWGLISVAAQERPALRCLTVDLSPAPDDELAALCDELLTDEGEDRVALRGRHRYVSRLRPAADSPSRPDAGGSRTRPVVPVGDGFRLEVLTPGVLDSLSWQPARRRPVPAGAVEIAVRAAALNFRDVMKALGVYPAAPGEEAWLGDECAGTIVNIGDGVEGLSVGDEVVAVAPACLGRFAITSADFVLPKPPGMAFEEAVTIPIAFATAHYALVNLARLTAGERCLIHAAAGGVGLAAVQLALRCGAEVLATAGSPEKRAYLRSLGVAHVMDSRSLDFADEVRAYTGGEGVDVVLNSLSGEAMRSSIGVLRAFGRFVEIGKRDIYENARIALKPFRDNLSYSAVDLDRLFRLRPAFARDLLRTVLANVERGVLAPLPRRVFDTADVVSAFRHLAHGRNTGKVVVSMSTGKDTRRADGTYLITGGLGGLGLTVAGWLAQRGATQLVLVGRREPSPDAAAAIQELRRFGTSVRTLSVDVADRAAVRALISHIERDLPPLRGVVHAAGVLADALIDGLDDGGLRKVMAAKVDGAWNLHLETVEQPLDFFVLFASVAALLGSPGQANYAAANAALDALAHLRRAQGLPGLSIDWGPWSGVGMASRPTGGRSVVDLIGGIAPADGLLTLERLLTADVQQAVVLARDWARLARAVPTLVKSPLLSEVVDGRTAESSVAQTRASLREELVSAEPSSRRAALVRLLTGEVAAVLEMEPTMLEPDQPLDAIGMDSLMALELKNRVERTLDITVPLVGLVPGTSIAALAKQMADLFTDAPDQPGRDQGLI